MQIKSLIKTWNLANKRVFLRTDYNVPLLQGTIGDEYRLTATLPTLHALASRGATIIIGTHRGRPSGYDPALSTQILIPWLEKNGYTVRFAPTLAEAQKSAPPGTLILLENLRFFAGEQSSDHAFARELASLADYYVNDSFGTLHHNDTSTTLTAELFAPDHRSIGLRIESELSTLNSIAHNPRRPLVTIFGGSKIADKLPLIQHLITHTDTIMLCPALVFTFLKTRGISVGTSLVDEKSMALCAEIMEQARKENKKIMFPVDYQVSLNSQSETLLISDTIPAHGMGISVGPRTVAAWAPIIQQAGTVFFNGAIGFIDQPKTLVGMQGILQAMEHSSGITIVAGGDSVAIAHALGVRNITHYALGGGAVLAYMSDQPLPGLAPFIEQSKHRTKSK